MAIKCTVCREPIGPPQAASQKPKTIAASAQGVEAMLRKRLHPEEQAAESPYAESIAANTSDAFALIRQKTRQKLLDEQQAKQAADEAESNGGSVAVMEAPAEATVQTKTSGKKAKAVKGKRGRPKSVKHSEELLTSDDEMAPVPLPPSPSADIITEPLADTPPLMAMLQQAAAEGDASKR